MRKNRCMPKGVVATLVLFVAMPVLAVDAVGQGSAGPLTTEGLHRQNNHSAASRAFGGVTFGSEAGAGSMFVNPASLQALHGLQISIAGYHRSRDLGQEQHFAPVRYYPNLSLLLEALTDQVPDPDPDLVGFTPGDSVQRPFDDIQPNWSWSNSSTYPLHAAVAVPFSLAGVSLAAGAGLVQYADLNHYYQNNNVLDPAVLSQRPLPTARPTDNNPLTVDWYQTIRSRDGSIRGYGVALAAHMERPNLTIGISGMQLDGSSDDFERDVRRGQLTFFANEFRADSSQGRVTRTGTSSFSGQEFTFSGILHGPFVSVGFTLKPPSRIKRTFELAIEGDTTGTPFSSSIGGEDRLELPWRGTVGLLLQPRERLRVGLEYELRPYTSATFTSATQEETSPWNSSSLFRIGTEYDLFSWLTIRGGIRGEAEVFIPEGSPIDDDPVTYRVFSAGLGLNVSSIRWNVAYEHARIGYEEIWASAVIRNDDRQHTISMDITWTIPVRW